MRQKVDPMTLAAREFLQSDKAYAGILSSIGSQKRIHIGNAHGSSLALVAGALSGSESARRTILIITPSTRKADEFTDAVSLFTELPVVRFPRMESDNDALPDFTSFNQRLNVVHRLKNVSDKSIVIAEADSIIQHIGVNDNPEESLLKLRAGKNFSLEKLTEMLVERSYDNVRAVEFPLEYSRRGGIIDIFPPAMTTPIRIEFDGDIVSSIRRFSVEDQTSVEKLNEVDLLMIRRRDVGKIHADEKSIPLPDILSDNSIIIFNAASQTTMRLAESARSREFLSKLQNSFSKHTSILSESLPVPEDSGFNLDVVAAERVGGGITKVGEELSRILSEDHAKVYLFVQRDIEKDRLLEIFKNANLPIDRLEFVTGVLPSGFGIGLPRTWFVSADQLFDRYKMRRKVKPSRYRRTIESFLELKVGDYVVHTSHGIGRFRGLTRMARRGRDEDYLIIEYSEKQLLYVPATNIGLVQKYIGGGALEPRLAKIGGTLWQKQKDRVKEALVDLATELLEIQALRQSRPGISFGSDTLWQHEFEATFPYEDTPDQEFATKDVKRDMETARPTDRLLCGDVGYGKTEIAMRAAFKAVDNGKQVAVLVPTTILAQQHYMTFTERMAEFPVIIDVLSRFRSQKEQKKIVERLKVGKIDIIIGTHRLLSEDIRFSDLGLLIIDEEQRFGVAHKERLKMMRAEVDILTLTATPIPRTLHMSLLGIKDISTLETAPLDRRSIMTEIKRWEPSLIRKGIIRELERGGQVFFVHNRVYNIEQIRRALENIVPEARFTVAHGQMKEDLLEERMLDFVEGKHDVLVSTTIIESGLDIPNVNTIFINRADHFGLADLHQLRGRVGRYKHQAYSYMLLPEHGKVSEVAEQRLRAIEEFNELGAGFKIAMRDLEIRGSGNLLGKEQSGHIAVVGYELYTKLLEEAVKGAKDEPVTADFVCEVDIHPEAYLPEDYIGDVSSKLEIYRKATDRSSEEALDALIAETRDRFGVIPEEAERFFDKHRLRIRGEEAGVFYFGFQGKTLIIKFRSFPDVEDSFGNAGSRLRLISPDTVYYDLGEKPKSQEDTLEIYLRVFKGLKKDRRKKPSLASRK